MDQNILILIGSPKSEKSTSNFISQNLEKELTAQKLNFSKIYLAKAHNQKEALLKMCASANKVILITPVYENNVPTTVLEFFTLASCEPQLFAKKQLFTIALTGFADPAAGSCLLTTCKLFADEMQMKDLGGIVCSPATLIDSAELSKSYKNLSLSLKLLAENLADNSTISSEVFALNQKPVIPAPIYRLAGCLMLKKTAKEIGKEVFYAKSYL